jgi:hypothetical protein
LKWLIIVVLGLYRGRVTKYVEVLMRDLRYGFTFNCKDTQIYEFVKKLNPSHCHYYGDKFVGMCRAASVSYDPTRYTAQDLYEYLLINCNVVLDREHFEIVERLIEFENHMDMDSAAVIIPIAATGNTHSNGMYGYDDDVDYNIHNDLNNIHDSSIYLKTPVMITYPTDKKTRSLYDRLEKKYGSGLTLGLVRVRKFFYSDTNRPTLDELAGMLKELECCGLVTLSDDKMYFSLNEIK